MTWPLRTLPAGPDLQHLAPLLAALDAALAGTGPAVRVAEPGPIAPGSRPDRVPDGVALVAGTSGSTGTPREVLLTGAALRASAAATDARLGGPAQWLLTLPPTHVAGLQVLVRSILAGTYPVVARPGPFTAGGFAADAARLTGRRRYVSLVPTQLHRLLAPAGPGSTADDAAAGRAALAAFDAVLIGGAAADPGLLERAAAAGATVVTTYGMSETCGGCVYDGRPLDGVEVDLDDDGRVLLAGPVLAAGYLGRPDLDAEAFRHLDGIRWLRTPDRGSITDGRLTVLGRLDDVLVSGGANVWPAAVERAIAEVPGVGEVCVVGVPDAEWGQVVVAAIVPLPGSPAPSLAAVRSQVARTLGAPAAPRRLLILERLPVRGQGKPDRRAVAALAAALPT